MRIVITSGPSYEPIDQVRRVTNSSSGELGTLLAEAFAEAGHSVVIFRGSASTFPAPLYPVEVIPFSTNDDLAHALERLPSRDSVTTVLHAAALCDYRVAEVLDASGQPVSGDKIPSRTGPLRLTLEPQPKLIASLRKLFPASILVGWKYELDGSTEDVRIKGRQQIDDCLTDACVMNGSAYGSGFGLISRAGESVHLADKPELCRFLVDWIERTPTVTTMPGDPSFHALSSFTSLSPFI
jgi:phosphopantothenoylcysteine synthetase/decarboxylase